MTPPGQTPIPLGRHLLARPLPRDGHCSGRYATYWNVFLFINFILLNPSNKTSIMRKTRLISIWQISIPLYSSKLRHLSTWQDRPSNLAITCAHTIAWCVESIVYIEPFLHCDGTWKQGIHRTVNKRTQRRVNQLGMRHMATHVETR